MNFFVKTKKLENWPALTGMVGNRFVMTLLGNLVSFSEFVMLLKTKGV